MLIAIVLMLAVAAEPQRIETQHPDASKVTRVETTMNHLTVIEVGEPVSTVAAGSSAFKIEWRDNKVFVQPTEPSAATNLFIWTASGRLNYELEPAGAVEQMDFAIDQPPVPTDSKPAATTLPSTPSAAPDNSTNTLLSGNPIWVKNWKEPKN